MRISRPVRSALAVLVVAACHTPSTEVRSSAPDAPTAPPSAAAPSTARVDAAAAEDASMSSNRKEPDGAAPAVDAQARRDALLALAKGLRTATSLEEVARLADAFPKNAGLEATGSLNPGDTVIQLVPPMAAADFAAAFGIRGAIGQSVGVHQSIWHVVETVSPGRWAEPRIGRWTVEATLAARPVGASVPGAPVGPTARLVLGATDVVRSVRLVLVP